MKFRRNLLMTTLAAAVVAVFPAGIALSQAPAIQGKKAAVQRAEPTIHQMIVKLRNPTATEKVSALGATRVNALSKTAGVRLKALRAMSGDASVLALDAPMSLSDARALAERLSADPAVEYAEPDMPVRRLQATPTDPSFNGRQWSFQVPGTIFNSTINLAGGGTKAFANTGGANFQTAWTTTTGVNTVVMAIIDSGVTLTHPDLTAALIPGGGYDFVTNTFIANDGDGRDADATDPGDWVDQAAVNASGAICDAMDIGDSSWHGTHMAGVAAAAWGGTVSGTSTAGAAPNIRILPIRALGRCGGVSSDVIDAMRWSAGLAVAGVPNNPGANRAKILNLSLGGGNACSTAYQIAVNEIVNAGVVIFAATGNEGAAAISAPASCTGVIAVTAHVINGDNADYSNIGPQVAISAPGGGAGSTLVVPNLAASDSANWIWSTVLFGATTPASNGSGSSSGSSGPAISGFTGTSPATPHAAATAALLLSMSPALPVATVRSLITSTARPHPAGGFCLSAMGLNNCGAGLLDAGAAMTTHNARRPTVNAGANQNAPAITAVTLSGSGTQVSLPTSTLSYAWTQTSGTPVTLTNANAQMASLTAPNVNGALGFALSVTDGNGYRNTATTAVTVAGAIVPTINTQPANLTVNFGQTAQFSVAATGPAPLTYQWQRAGAPIGGATASTYAIAAAATADNGVQFRVVVTNTAGTVLSNAAMLTVVGGPPPPPPSSGGGGSLPLWNLLLMAAFAVAGGLRRRA